MMTLLKISFIIGLIGCGLKIYEDQWYEEVTNAEFFFLNYLYENGLYKKNAEIHYIDFITKNSDKGISLIEFFSLENYLQYMGIIKYDYEKNVYILKKLY